MLSPADIVKKMMAKDTFSNFLGIEILEIAEGKCKLKMIVKDDMLNGFHIAHGGISYSLSDSAMAFASNSYGMHAVSIESSISHIKPIRSGEVLTAEAIEISRNNKIGVYQVKILSNDKLLISDFKGTVYITSRKWE